MPEPRTCPECGRSLPPNAARNRIYHIGCAGLAHRRKLAAQADGKRKGPLPPLKCRCGKTFTPRYTGHVNCSSQCRLLS